MRTTIDWLIVLFYIIHIYLFIFTTDEGVALIEHLHLRFYDVFLEFVAHSQIDLFQPCLGI